MSALRPEATIPDLATIVEQVFGDLAFMIADAETAAAAHQPCHWLVGSVEYFGASRGQIECWCTQGLAVGLAANLLGLDPADPAAGEAAPDAVREFLNVLCGHLVTEWYGTEAVFNLSIPLVQPCAQPPELAAGKHACRLLVDGELFIGVHTITA